MYHAAPMPKVFSRLSQRRVLPRCVLSFDLLEGAELLVVVRLSWNFPAFGGVLFVGPWTSLLSEFGGGWSLLPILAWRPY